MAAVTARFAAHIASVASPAAVNAFTRAPCGCRCGCSLQGATVSGTSCALELQLEGVQHGPLSAQHFANPLIYCQVFRSL